MWILWLFMGHKINWNALKNALWCVETGSSQAGGVEMIVRIISSMGRWYYGASINDATHLEGEEICQKVTLLHKTIL